jgi:hypothetical protein
LDYYRSELLLKPVVGIAFDQPLVELLDFELSLPERVLLCDLPPAGQSQNVVTISPVYSSPDFLKVPILAISFLHLVGSEPLHCGLDGGLTQGRLVMHPPGRSLRTDGKRRGFLVPRGMRGTCRGRNFAATRCIWPIEGEARLLIGPAHHEAAVGAGPDLKPDASMELVLRIVQLSGSGVAAIGGDRVQIGRLSWLKH